MALVSLALPIPEKEVRLEKLGDRSVRIACVQSQLNAPQIGQPWLVREDFADERMHRAGVRLAAPGNEKVGVPLGAADALRKIEGWLDRPERTGDRSEF